VRCRVSVSVSNFQVSARLLWRQSLGLGLVSKFEPGLGIGDYGLDYVTANILWAPRNSKWDKLVGPPWVKWFSKNLKQMFSHNFSFLRKVWNTVRGETLEARCLVWCQSILSSAFCMIEKWQVRHNVVCREPGRHPKMTTVMERHCTHHHNMTFNMLSKPLKSEGKRHTLS